MENKDYVDLHCHSAFSQLDGIGTPKQIAERAKEMGFKYVSITDHGNLDCALKLQSECAKHGLIPIIGSELYVVPDHRIKQKEKRGHCTVLVKNEIGYKNLLRMLTIANLEGFYYRPRVGYKTLLAHCEGLIIMTACIGSFVNLPGGEDLLRKLAGINIGDVYGEIMPHCIEEQKKQNATVVDFSIDGSEFLPIVATGDQHYISKDHAVAREIMLLVRQKDMTWNNPKRRPMNEAYDLHMKSADFMIEEFERQGQFSKSFVMEAMKNSIVIAKKCGNFRIAKKPINLPSVPGVPVDEVEYFTRLIEEGCVARFGQKRASLSQEYRDRIDEEIEAIAGKGFIKYFLIVHELIHWCRKNDILPGPGRGSVGGAMCAFLLGITHSDPIVHNLPFSRFINIERIDFPDIDADYPKSKREKVIDHLREIYGDYNIANISTFLTFQDKGVFRDVCKIFEVPQDDTNNAAKQITEDLQTFLDTKEGKSFDSKYPEVIKNAIALHGQIRNSGRHAAGMIVSSDDLRTTDRCNLAIRDNTVVTNWDGNDSEHQGLMKLDILGLATLDVLSEAKRLIQANGKILLFHPESESCFLGTEEEIPNDGCLNAVDFEFEKLPFDDQKVFKSLSDGKTIGIFQFGTKAMTKLVKRMGIEKFSHMSDAVALVRPGPMESGMTDIYINRKHGQQWEKKHSKYEKVLEDTYGTVLFQEDLMNVVNKVAGLPYPVADKIRKVVAKKQDIEGMKIFKDEFVNGCVNQDELSRDEAEELWDDLEKNAGYLFNRAHSVLYAMISYWCAWLREYAPGEFICASLTYDDKTPKNDLLKEARRIGLKVMPPKMGISDGRLWKVVNDILYAPFIEIKGIGEKVVDELAKPIVKVKRTKGFFRKSQPLPEAIKGKTAELIRHLGCFDPTLEDLPDDATQYFEFDIGISVEKKYPKLINLVGKEKFDSIIVDDLIAGSVTDLNLASTGVKFKLKGLNKCVCDFCKKKKPVHPSYNTATNIFIIGDTIGLDEDKSGDILVGDAGKKLWEELGRLELERDIFHVTTSVKCMVKNPSDECIDCCRKWLDQEIETAKPVLALSLGNAPLYYFNKERGIKRMNGTTEWNEYHGLWVCYCVHPSYVLRNIEEIELFREGLRNFSDAIKNIGGI